MISPSDRVATVAAILKGDSLTAFEAALEDAQVDLLEHKDEDDPELLVMTQEHVKISLRTVTTVVFPF